MKKIAFPLLVVAACTAWVAARAQTGRIAHFSHGGSAGTLAAASRQQDNFGGYVYYSADSVRYVSPMKVVRYGVWSHRVSKRSQDTLNLAKPMAAAAAYRYLRANRYLLRHDDKPIKFIGFDSVGAPAGPVPPTESKPRRRKEATLGHWPTLPPGPGPAALLAALAGAGWLLAGRRSKAAFAA